MQKSPERQPEGDVFYDANHQGDHHDGLKSNKKCGNRKLATIERCKNFGAKIFLKKINCWYYHGAMGALTVDKW